MSTTIQGCAELMRRLDAAVAAGGLEATTASVKRDLEEVLGRGALRLPDHFKTPRPDTYARRLLHRDPAGRYAAIVMTWGVGQGTPVHDHGGLWCVEGVVEGAIAVTQYDVTPDADGFFRVQRRGTITAGVGTAGRLIPPVDYHVIANALPDAPSVTLHVYGGDLNRCSVFTPTPDGRYRESIKSLSFHD
jgi:predicted metal-dependent enzyme (double-stranded beta helix superfamily)